MYKHSLLSPSVSEFAPLWDGRVCKALWPFGMICLAKSELHLHSSASKFQADCLCVTCILSQAVEDVAFMHAHIYNSTWSESVWAACLFKLLMVLQFPECQSVSPRSL